jgi:hypothetical protein
MGSTTATVTVPLPNNKGAWVVGNARSASSGSFSATVKLLPAPANLSGACAYAINYPPVGRYTANNNITFTGTPPFALTFRQGNTATVESGEALNYSFSPDNPPVSFTDLSGAPGTFSCAMPVMQTLQASATVYCAGSGVVLALANTQAGAVYQLYKDGGLISGATVTTSLGGAATFTGSYSQGAYTVQTVPGAYCPAVMNGSPVITEQPYPAQLSLAVNPTAICKGQSSTLTASADDAASYSLDGTDWQENTEFYVTPEVTSSYTLYVSSSAGCSATLANAATVAVHGAISPGSITTASTTTNMGTAPAVTLGNEGSASGGSGNLAYVWVRTSTSSATLTGTAETYNLSDDELNYSTAGIYYFNRYALDNVCSGYVAVAASGTYTLGVMLAGKGGTIPSNLCTKCCYDGDSSAWVDCFVTVETITSYAKWSGRANYFYEGASGALAHRDGKANTSYAMADTASPPTKASAIGACSNLGDGKWFLPACEELINMGNCLYNDAVNGLTCADVLPSGIMWSSTETYGNIYGWAQSKTYAISTTDNGKMSIHKKTGGDWLYSVCAWRN